MREWNDVAVKIGTSGQIKEDAMTFLKCPLDPGFAVPVSFSLFSVLRDLLRNWEEQVSSLV